MTHNENPPGQEKGNACPYAIPASSVREHFRMILTKEKVGITATDICALDDDSTKTLLCAFAASICEFKAVQSIEKHRDSAAEQVLFPGLREALSRMCSMKKVVNTAQLSSEVKAARDKFCTADEKTFKKYRFELAGYECDWKLIWAIVLEESARHRSSQGPPRTDKNSLLRPPPSSETERSRSDTIRAATSASYLGYIRDNDLDASHVQQAVEMDIHDITTLPDFDNHHFSNVSYDVAKTYLENPAVKAAIDQLGQQDLEEDLAKALVNVCIQVGKLVQGRSSHSFVECGDRNPEANMVPHKVDFCLVDDSCLPAPVPDAPEADRYTAVQTSFEKMLAISELKPSVSWAGIRTNNLMLKTEAQLARYVYNAFRVQTFRQHIYGFILQGTTMRHLLFDHCGVCSSDSFDIRLNPIRFVRSLASYLTMDLAELGNDPNCASTPAPAGTGGLTVSMAGGTDVYELVKPIHTPYAFVGRATSIWKAKRIGGTGTETSPQIGETVIIKDSWQSKNRREEGEMLKQALDSKAPLFPGDFEPRHRHHISEWPKPRRFATYVSHEKAKYRNSIITVYNTIRRFVRPSISRAGQQTTAAHSNCVRPDFGYDEKADREHRRVVVKYLECKKIENLASPLDLFTVIRDCIDGHWALYQAGVLHRDVSKDNLMVALKAIEPAAEGQPQPCEIKLKPDATKRITPSDRQKAAAKQQKATTESEAKGMALDYGFVIDLDFAANHDLSTRVPSQAPFATGNKQFMAREVLDWLSKCQSSYSDYEKALRRGDSEEAQEELRAYEEHLSQFKQEYRHDLESFYWVLLWCLFQMSHKGEGKMNGTFDTWKDPRTTFDTVFGLKDSYFITKYKQKNYFTGLVGLDSATAEVTFGSLLVSLTKVLSDTETLAALPAEELYCQFQRALTKIIEFLKAN